MHLRHGTLVRAKRETGSKAASAGDGADPEKVGSGKASARGACEAGRQSSFLGKEGRAGVLGLMAVAATVCP